MSFKLGRAPYAIVLGAILLAAIAANIAGRVYGVDLSPVARFWWVPLLVMTGVTVPRLRDAGWNPWLALVCILPGLGFILGLILCFRPSTTKTATSA